MSVWAQGSQHALRFFGTGSGQQDRAKFRLDAPTTGLDVGHDFTLDFWLRADYADNAGTVSAAATGDGWITGNVVVDRDVYGEGDYGDYGLALGRAGPHLRMAFGADAASGLTIVGTNHVGDGTWHHIAVTRAHASGQMRIFVDGRLDAEGTGPTGDLSYRDGRATSWPQSDPFLVLAAEKHDAGPAYPSLNGYLDEVRVWTQALTQAQISNVFRSVIASNTAGLVAYYRFEEGTGTNLADSAGRSPVGQLIAGATGNGQWMARSANTNNTAPVQPAGDPPPSVQVHLATVPAGLLLAVDGVTQATPVSVSVATGSVVILDAPSNQVAFGTAYVFRCWSDGGARSHTLALGTTEVSRRAGYAPAPGGSIAPAIPAANRQAESYSGNTAFANVYDGNALCCGRDSGGRFELALAFPLEMPPGVTVQSAHLRVRATADQSNQPGLVLRAFATNQVSAFTAGAGASVTGLHPLTSAAVTWTPSAFTPGQTYDSPDLASVVQTVINLPGWNAGQYLGLVLFATNTSGDHWRCWNNFQSGTPPVLLVTYAYVGPVGADLDGDGLPDDWEAGNGLDCTADSDADSDTDGDQRTAWEEYVATTSPTNGQSFQRLEIVPAATSNGWKISFATSTGRLYRVEMATNLASAAWLPLLTNGTGTGFPLELSDTNAGTPRFFRSDVRLDTP